MQIKYFAISIPSINSRVRTNPSYKDDYWRTGRVTCSLFIYQLYEPTMPCVLQWLCCYSIKLLQWFRCYSITILQLFRCYSSKILQWFRCYIIKILNWFHSHSIKILQCFLNTASKFYCDLVARASTFIYSVANQKPTN